MWRRKLPIIPSDSDDRPPRCHTRLINTHTWPGGVIPASKLPLAFGGKRIRQRKTVSGRLKALGALGFLWHVNKPPISGFFGILASPFRYISPWYYIFLFTHTVLRSNQICWRYVYVITNTFGTLLYVRASKLPALKFIFKNLFFMGLSHDPILRVVQICAFWQNFASFLEYCILPGILYPKWTFGQHCYFNILYWCIILVQTHFKHFVLSVRLHDGFTKLGGLLLRMPLDIFDTIFITTNICMNRNLFQ